MKTFYISLCTFLPAICDECVDGEVYLLVYHLRYIVYIAVRNH